jgi:hypothetical protein
MPITFLAPLPPADGWISHRQEVKRCRGAACYAALANHFGSDSPKVLEWRVDRRKPYRGAGDESLSNKYRRWRQGTAPGDDTVDHVVARSAGAVRLDLWRDLGLWDLLSPEPPSISWMHRLLERSTGSIRRILFGPAEFSKQVHHSLLSRSQTLAIRNQYSLEAFVTLLCLARKGEVLEDDPRHFLPAACAFDIFPRILYTHQPLRYRWEQLSLCLERIFWKRVYSTGAYYPFPIDTLRSSLRALDADPNAVLPRISGKRFRVIDSDPIRRLEERIARAVSVT